MNVWCRVAGSARPLAGADWSPKSNVQLPDAPCIDSVKATSSGAGPRAGEARMESAPCVPTATSEPAPAPGPKRPSLVCAKQPARDGASRTRAAHRPALGILIRPPVSPGGKKRSD